MGDASRLRGSRRFRFALAMWMRSKGSTTGAAKVSGTDNALSPVLSVLLYSGEFSRMAPNCRPSEVLAHSAVPRKDAFRAKSSVRVPSGPQLNRRNLSNSKGSRRFLFCTLSPALSVWAICPLQLVTMSRSPGRWPLFPVVLCNRTASAVLRLFR